MLRMNSASGARSATCRTLALFQARMKELAQASAIIESMGRLGLPQAPRGTAAREAATKPQTAPETDSDAETDADASQLA